MTTVLLAIEGAPDNLHAPINGHLFFAIFGVLSLITVLGGYWWTSRLPDARHHAITLSLFIIGGALAVLVEGTFDFLGKIHYAQNTEPMLYSSFDQHIPAHLVFGYIPFTAVLPFVLAIKMAEGLSRKTLVLIAVVTGVAGAGIDALGAVTNSWGYYGGLPSSLLGVAPQMAGEPLVAGALAMLLLPMLKGPARALLVLLPGSVLAGTYAFSGWPTYVALYSNAGTWADWLAGTVTLLLCAAIIWFVAMLVGHPGAATSSSISRRSDDFASTRSQ